MYSQVPFAASKHSLHPRSSPKFTTTPLLRNIARRRNPVAIGWLAGRLSPVRRLRDH